MNFPKLNLTPQKKMILILAVVALIATIGIAAAISLGIRSPDSDPGTVNPTPPPPTLSKVTISPSTITVGQTWTLSTTLSNGASGVTVDFYNQVGTKVGTAITDAAGTATVVFQPPVGTWVYHANA